ncbi:FAD-dependent oxidoreductase, partial [Mycobacteroides abscessus]|uniref:FAD-dependent oxidoreductase n=1 Tax=Mycobacteroides abscessus TaxID=36809 RepID=UPI00138FA1E1
PERAFEVTLALLVISCPCALSLSVPAVLAAAHGALARCGVLAIELKADKVLQDKLYSLDNVTVLTNVETKAIYGQDKVDSLAYMDRDTQEVLTLELAGVFILIGLVPNTEWLEGSVDRTARGEIIVDKQGATNLPGVYAAGDCTDSVYKQIIIAMGSGATAALGAFDYIIRH